MDIRTLSDLRTPWCIHVVATLRIADRMASGLTEIDELATAVQCDAPMLRRVLRHLAGRGVFIDAGADRFDLNEPARQLLDESIRLYHDLDGVGGRFAHAWGTLLTAVRTGHPGYEDLFGLPFWEDLDAHPEIGASFDALMGPVGHGAPDPHILLAEDWNGVNSVVDVGGGSGALLAAILQAHPRLRGTLVDLPRVVANSTDTFRAAGVEDRVTVIGQSFFDPLPAGADLYLLRGVLNDWPEAETVKILTRCAQAAEPSSGRIVINGGIRPDETSSDELTVEMVLFAGQNNSIREFQQLAASAGLEVSATGQTPTRSYLVECRPISR